MDETDYRGLLVRLLATIATSTGDNFTDERMDPEGLLTDDDRRVLIELEDEVDLIV